jgi:peptide/nickel transport system permease protein
MLKVIGRRLLVAIPTLFVIATLTFMLLSMLPGDPAVTILGPDASPAQYAQLRQDLGLDQPLWTQYGNWMLGALHGDFGTSIVSGRSVVTAISERVPLTLSIAVLGTLVTLVLGVALGLVSALRGGWVAKGAQITSVLGVSVPNFWLGVLLVFVFSIYLGWFPATGFVAFGESPIGWVRSLTLPVVTVALAGVAAIARQTRASMNEALSKDFIRTLLASGTPRTKIIFKHALRNASIPVVTSLGFQFVTILGGALIIEQVFGLPGLGGLTISAVNTRDLPLVQGVVLLTAVIVIVINLVVDVLYSILNPKVRQS